MTAALRTLAAIGIALLSACTPGALPTPGTEEIEATVNAILTEDAPPTSPPATPEPTATSGPSFEATTYRDEVSGYEFQHPIGWTVGPVAQQSRGGITAFTSWERPTDVFPGATPAGGTRMDATVQLWDPKGDLEAFLQQRLTAWEGSGIGAVLQEEWTLSDGRAAKAYLLTGSDGAQSYVFLTTLGDNYLVLSGEGDLGLLAEIAHTVEPIRIAY